jgi:diguanylate cyclase (GGDEF)-like protein
MKILLVEDTRAIAAVMAMRLAAFGHEVEIAENGKIAVDKFPQTQPDLILMDIEMPVMSGFEATTCIRAIEATQQWAWTPILFLTASDTVENLVTAIEAGGDDFISKTVPEVVLQAKMKAMARIAGLRQRLSVANRKLEELACHDGLTGLYNRRAMDQRLDLAWVEASRSGQAFGLLMLDVDNFKKYNDHYGHQAGDDCLRTIARALENAVMGCRTAGAFVARYGGEEFAVVLPTVTVTELAESAERVLEQIRQCCIPHEKNADWGIATISVGGIWLDKCVGMVGAMFRAADAYLYQAKQKGRNRAEIGPLT